MMPELLKYRKNVHSQNGEDGLLQELLRRLEIKTGWFCEFGAWDGKYLSNTFCLLEQGWNGVMIEGDAARAADLRQLSKTFSGRLHAIEAFVSPQRGPDSLDELLARTPIPRNFEILSVDVDGLDYQIWSTVDDYHPAIVVIEVNSDYPPGIEHIHSVGAPSSSISSMIALGRQKGYVPVAHTGNLILVRQDLAAKVCNGDASCRGAKQQFLYTRKSAAGSVSRTIRLCWQRLAQYIET